MESLGGNEPSIDNSANYGRLLEIVDEMTLINMELLKNEPTK